MQQGARSQKLQPWLYSPAAAWLCRLHTAERKRKMQRQLGLLAAAAVALAAAELWNGSVTRGYRSAKRQVHDAMHCQRLCTVL